MISQSLYFDLCRCTDKVINHDSLSPTVDEFSFFKRPYVLVIHRPSGRGFYLDREYRHILDVSNCQEPENPTEVARHHLCTGDDLPEWALQIKNSLRRTNHFDNFDSFWLY